VQVLYGVDFTAEGQQRQHNVLKAALLEHLRQAPESCEHIACLPAFLINCLLAFVATCLARVFACHLTQSSMANSMRQR
jgi:hypothetical protein